MNVLPFGKAARYLWVLSVVLLVLMCAGGIACAQEEGESEEPGGERVPVDPLDMEEQEKGYTDEKQQEWSEVVTSTANWMDAFFDDELYRTTSNKTYLRIKVAPVYNHKGFYFDSLLDLRLRLPNTERWLINFGTSLDDDEGFGSSTVEEVESEDSGDDATNAYLGVETFFKRTRTRNISTGGGVKWRLGNSALYGTLKWVELWEFDDWDIRAIQRFRVYTDEPAEFKTKLEGDWFLAHKYMFRTSGSAVFKYDDPSSYYDLDFSLYHFLTTRTALQYSIKNGYKSTEDRLFHLDKVVGEVEYRKQWKDWFYTSLVPQLVMSDSRDWRLDPGIRLNFNVRLGHVDKYAFQSSYDRKQQANEVRTREQRDKALQESHERLQQWLRSEDELDVPPQHRDDSP